MEPSMIIGTVRNSLLRALAVIMMMLSAHLAEAAPACIQNLQVKSKAGVVQLTWTSVVGTTSSEVQRGPAIAGPFAPIATLAGAASAYLDTSVVNGTTYYYQIHRIFTGGDCLSDV